MSEDTAPRVVAIGDSLIYGRLDAQSGGWVGLLRAWLEQDGPEGSAVFNLGIGGNTSVAVSERTRVELPPRTPNAVIFGVGTNDLRRVDGPNDEHEVDPDTYQQRLVMSVRTAIDLGARVAIAGIIPVDENRTRPHNGYWYSNADVALYDGIARDVAAGEGALHIDFARAFATPETPYQLTRQDLLADGIHPNAAGHQGMFESARAALHEWLGL
jgi:acyl-CoA thioesterase-1